MQSVTDALLQETLYHQTLASGLKVFVLPRPGFRQTAATFATYYGSMDSRFVPPGGKEAVAVPDGIAHFLEHQLFAEEQGDISAEFAKLGASVNAFTSWFMTNYYFTTAADFEPALDLLLNFVQEPHFTPEGVKKEQGIIEQELQMFEDMPERRSLMSLLQAMYHNHPVALEIGGTVESIYRITPEDLYLCYNTFYHPSNMVLFVAGDVEPGRVVEQAARAVDGRGHSKRDPIERLTPAEPETVRQQRTVVELSVAQPILRLGFKEHRPRPAGTELLRQELATLTALEAVIGKGSDLYHRLYVEGLIDKRFGYDYAAGAGFGFSYLGGPTRDADALQVRLLEGFAAVAARGLDEAEFLRAKRKGMGRFLSLMDNLHQIAYLFNEFYFKGIDYFALIPTAESLTLDETNARLREHLVPERCSASVINPKGT